MELLKVFCGSDETRPSICKPFTIDEFTYASDGRIAVRVPKLDAVGGPDAEFQSSGLLVSYFNEPTDWKYVEPPPLPMLPKCEQCSGTGKTDCVTCGCCGETVELNATITCPDCEGNGETLWDVKVDFGHHHLNAFYLEKLLKLPGVRLAANNDPAGVMAIKFDGGEGVLMPMRKN